MSVDFSITIELEHICKDGSLRNSEVLVKVIFNEEGRMTGIHGVSRDITERNKVENALRESEEKWRTINNTSPDGISIASLEGELLFISEKLVKMHGYTSPEEMLGQSIFEFVDEKYHEKAKIRYAGLLDGTLTGPTEYLLCRKDGSRFYKEINAEILHDSAGNPSKVFFIERDISERKKAEEKIHEVEERFRLAFQTSPDSININRMSDGLYVAVNDGFTRLTGFTAEETVGKTSTEIDIWNNKVDRQKLIRLLTENKSVANFETQFRFKDGTIHIGLMSANVIQLQGVPHIISITRDIDEIKKVEEELRQAKENAEESSRLKTAFLNNISHEIRTPMNAILGFTDLLQSEDPSCEEKERYFGIINSNSRQLLSIIDDVLEISRMDSGRIPLNLHPFSLHELMEDIHFSLLGLAHNSNLKLRVDYGEAGKADQINADREKIRQVLVGLIGNAVKYTTEGEINFGYTLEDSKIRFYVQDTGIGISLPEKEKIFERFYQVTQPVHRGSRGTGLGLSIAKGLVEMMGGVIRVESEPGIGSVFSFDIPLNRVPYQSPAIVSSPITVSFSELIILIAEDEEFNFEYLRILLSKKIKKVIWAKHGGEVLPLVEENRPDLILMDMKMPVLNGLDATKQLKMKYPNLPVIALTAYTQPEDESNAIQAGCSGFVSKPIRKQELMEAIQRVLS